MESVASHQSHWAPVSHLDYELITRATGHQSVTSPEDEIYNGKVVGLDYDSRGRSLTSPDQELVTSFLTTPSVCG